MTALIDQGIKHGAHGIIIADDIAYQQGTYMSPAFGERYLLPLWRRQVMAAKALDTPMFFHSDGNIDPSLLCGPDSSVVYDEGCQNLDRAVADLITAVGGSGGLIVGSCSGLHAGMSPHRVCRLYERVSKSKQA